MGRLVQVTSLAEDRCRRPSLYILQLLFKEFNLNQIVCDHGVHILVPMGLVLGFYLDRRNDENLTAFRDKGGLLFKRKLRPSEEVTWK
ncbi:NADH dehydrogenase [ubiquinone] 1 beta subcomplex subunit 1-like [Molossus molossus]|uniref:NADH dehydrogenase [ubiquinone] 1 beta subcomplex subunit 1-like n=1 Tax=Molossus molossus TaxID=27622 RepID=UPI00174684FB|nr:NADH dehydrogenase [ubiquinone] 1 beta subcomplex subunit 1-like [Molossus molossus]